MPFKPCLKTSLSFKPILWLLEWISLLIWLFLSISEPMSTFIFSHPPLFSTLFTTLYFSLGHFIPLKQLSGPLSQKHSCVFMQWPVTLKVLYKHLTDNTVRILRLLSNNFYINDLGGRILWVILMREHKVSWYPTSPIPSPGEISVTFLRHPWLPKNKGKGKTNG